MANPAIPQANAWLLLQTQDGFFELFVAVLQTVHNRFVQSCACYLTYPGVLASVEGDLYCALRTAPESHAALRHALGAAAPLLKSSSRMHKIRVVGRKLWQYATVSPPTAHAGGGAAAPAATLTLGLKAAAAVDPLEAAAAADKIQFQCETTPIKFVRSRAWPTTIRTAAAGGKSKTIAVPTVRHPKTGAPANQRRRSLDTTSILLRGGVVLGQKLFEL